MPKPRWGVRFTSDPNKTENYIQDLYDDDPLNARRGELFLNEPARQMFYVDGGGTVRRVGSLDIIPFTRIDFTGLREFANDTDAAAATPAVPVGGMYRTGSVLKVRVS
jgi:hypothetical protein